MWVYKHTRVHTRISTGACRAQKRLLNTLELQLWTAVSCPMWVLGTELSSSAKEMHALNQ